MKKVLLRTFCSVTLLVLLLSSFSIHANPIFSGNLPVAKPAADATFRKNAVRPDVIRKSDRKTAPVKQVANPQNSFLPAELTAAQPDLGLVGPVMSCPVGIATITYADRAIQTFKIPSDATSVTIRAIGGNGGDKTTSPFLLGGKGAIMQGSYSGMAGKILHILVGQKGSDEYPLQTEKTGGGGGGTFIFTSPDFDLDNIDYTKFTKEHLLIAAGGGGGAGNGVTPSADGQSNINANTDQSGYYGGLVGAGANGAPGEINPMLGGMGGYPSAGATGGAGIGSSGVIQDESLEGAELEGIAPKFGGFGGGTTQYEGSFETGGFGGGGCSYTGGGGGGGGYSGGGAGATDITTFSAYGGGGGSYITGQDSDVKVAGQGGAAEQAGNGVVVITWTVSKPTISASSDSPITVGGTLHLSSTSPNTILSYAWVGPNGFTSTDQNPSIAGATLAAAGSYTVTGTDANGCTAKATTPVVVNPLSVPLVPGTIGTPQTICSGTIPAALTSLTAASGGTGTISYQWQSSTDNVSFTNISGATAAGYAPGALTNSTYYKRAAVTASVTEYTTSVKITVTQPQLHVTSIYLPQSSICAGSTATLQAFIDGPGGTFKWYDAATGGNLLSQPGYTYVTGALSTTTTFWVDVTDVNGCTSDRVSETITVKPNPVVTVSGSTTVCSGGSTTLTANSSVSGATFVWRQLPANTIVSNLGTYSPNNLTTATTYNVQATANGCTSALTTVTVNVNTTPTPTITAGGATTFCAGGSVTLTSSAATGNVWSTGSTAQSITVSATGSYTVTATANNCSATSVAKAVTVNPIPATPTVGVVNNCDGTSTLTASGYTGSLLWSTGAVASSIAVTSTGTYTVTQTVSGCTSAAGSGVANPKTRPATIAYNVADNCSGVVTITATNLAAGASILWSDGATTNPITVTTAGTYGATQTLNGCTSLTSSTPVATPRITPAAPTVVVADNCDGTSTLTASNYAGTLQWSFTASNASVQSVSVAGTYGARQVVSGCPSLETQVTAAPKTTPTAPTVTVTDNCNGTSTLVASNYTGTLLWSNGATPASTTVSSAGTYTVTQTLNGCTSAAGSGVAAPKSTPAAPTVSVTDNCNNTSTLTASNYTGTLLWSNTAITASITVSSAGTYTVTQTLNGCTSAAGSGVATPKTTPAAPTVSVTDNCNNTSTLTASNYTGTLLWSNTATTASITVSSAGTYTVTQTLNGCTSAAGSGVAAPKTTPAAPTVSVTDNCNNTSTLTASNYTGTLLWSNTATTASITVSSAGTYTVTQTLNGCTSAAGSGVAAPKATPVVTISTDGPTTFCAGGSVVLTSSSATNNSWSNGATTQAITVSASGTFAITVNNNGCVATSANTVVTVNPLPSAPTGTGNSRCGAGDVVISASAGEVIDWYANASGGSPIASGSNTYTAIGHGTTTTYYAQARNTTTGCVSATRTPVTATINYPTIPTISSNAMPTTFCNGGSVTLTSSSAANNVWSTGETTQSIVVTTSGNYTVSVTTAGCQGTSAVTAVTVKPTPSTPTVSAVDNCGTSILTASNYTGSLLWSTGQGSSSITVSSAGTYTVTQTVDGCVSAAGSGVAAPKTTPVAPTVTVHNDCGISSLTASNYTGSLLWSTGATGSVIVSFSPGGTYTVTQTVNGCTSAPGTGTAVPNTPPPTPTITVTNNCDGTSILTASNYTGTLIWSTGETTPSITVTTSGTRVLQQTINGCNSAAAAGFADPKAAPVAPTISVVDNCNGTSTLTASNYTGSLLWSTGAATSSITVPSAGTYTVTQTVGSCTSVAGSGVAAPKTTPTAPTVSVTDNCDNTSTITASGYTGSLLWSNGATTSSITVSTAGTYTVTQTLNGCTSAAGSGIAAPKTTPVAPTVTVQNDCGISSLTASGYTGSLLWSNGATTSSITVSTAGTYTVTQTLNGCTSAAGSGVAAPKTTPVAPTVTVHNDCGISSLTASGYTGTLLWSTGATGSVIVSFSPGGTYTVTQTVNGCTSAPGTGTAVPNTPPPTPTVTVTNNCDGTSILTASNYTGTLIWSTGETTPSITVTTSGSRVVQQTVNGCNSAAAAGFADPKTAPVAPTISVFDNCNGTSTLTAVGVTGSLLWSTGATTSSITVNSAGTYTVTQTVGSCTSLAGSATAAPKTAPSVPIVSAVDNCDGTSVLTASAYTGSLLWSNGATTSSITVSTSGTYTVTQTVNGCTSLTASVFANPKSIPATPAVTVTNNCGFSFLSIGAGAGSVLWSNGATTSGNNVPAGTYTVTRTVNGCTSLPGTGVAAPKSIPASVQYATSPNCDGSITVTATNATGTLVWTPNGETTSSVNVTVAGSYGARQTVDGCQSAPTSITVTPVSLPVTYNVSGGAAVCSNVNSAVSISLSGSQTGVSYLLFKNGVSTGMTIAGTGAAISFTAPVGVFGPGIFTIKALKPGLPTSCDYVMNGSASITRLQAPIVTITGNTEICAGVSQTLTANVTGSSTSNLSYAWYNNTVLDEDFVAATQSINSVLNGDWSYYVAVTDNTTGCVSAKVIVITVKAKPATPIVTVTDNCDGTSTLSTNATGTLVWSNGATTSSITISSAGTYTVIQTANGCTSDAGSGITAPKTTPVAVVTAGGPTSVCPGANVVLHANTGAGYTYQWLKDGNTISGATSADYTATATGNYSVVIAANGCASAPSNAVQVTVSDVTPPVTPTLADVTAECSKTVTEPTTTDACSGTVTGTTSDPLTYTTQGTHVIHWTFTDASGNSTTADQNVIIKDVTPPNVVCPANITRPATTTGSGYGALVTYTATATDNCGTPTVTYNPASGSFFPVGTTTVTVTADDGHGHTTACRFDVTVIAPEINITGNSVNIVDGDASPSATDHTDFGSTTLNTSVTRTYTIQNTGNDNLDVSAINISDVDAANFTLSGFTATTLAPGASATFNVTFLSNTVGTKNATVTVSNNDNDESSYDFAIAADINCSTPVFTACPSNKTVNTDAGLCSAVVTYATTVTGVPTPSLTYTFSGATTGSGSGNGSGSVFNKGTTNVTIRANNACGSVVCSFTITVEDRENPVITNVPAAISQSNDAGVCGARITWALPVATDNCPIVTLVSDKHSGDVFPIGTTTVHYTATDASGNTSTASFTVTVNDTEDPTITIPSDVTHTADAGLCSYKFANTVNDINTVTPDGPTPGYGPNAILLGAATGTDNCGVATVVGLRSDGQPLTAPYPVGTTTVNWTITDSHGRTTTGVQTIVITDDEFPLIHNLPASISTSTDANSCNAIVTWVAPTATDNCAVTMVSDKHPGDVFAIGTTAVTYTATDVHGHVTTGTFNVTVADNQTPTIVCPGSFVIPAEAGKNGANVTYTATATDNCGTPTVTYSITPGSLFPIGTTQVIATATDAYGNVMSCAFDVTVTNNPPVAKPDVNTTTEDTPVSANVLPNDYDVDGHVLTVATFTINSVSYTAGQTTIFPEGTLVLNANGSYTYTPAPNFNGTVPVVTYYITDGHGGTANTTLKINVTPVNDGPVANPDTNTTPEDTPVSGNVLPNDTDIDGDHLTVTGFVINGTPYTPGTVANIPGIGTLVINADGSYTYTPAPNYNGPVPVVTYSITDGNGGAASSTLTINVTPVDDAPVAVNDTETVNEDGVLTSTVTGNDTPSGDGGNVWSVVTTTTHGILVFNPNGTYTYTPNANFNGTDVFTYKVCDADGDCSTATVTITVNSVDDAPVAVNDTETVNEDGLLTSTVTGNDTPSGDGGNVWSVVTTTTHGTLVFNPNGTYTYTPNANFNGTDVFTYKVCDADGDCSTATVTITVNSVDDVPVAVNDTETVNEDGVLTSTVTGNDTPSGDGGNVWSVVTTTTHGTLVFNPNGTYTYTPSANFNGTDVFTYTVCDADGDCSTATVTITVVSVDDVPVAVNDTETVNEDGVLTSTVTGNDTPSGDGGNVWSVVTTTTHGTLVFNPNGTYTYTPNANFNGTDVFTYKVCDADGDCSTAAVTITVVSVDDVPVAVNDTETVNEDGVLTSTVTGNDTPSGDGGNVWSVVTTTTHGTLVFNPDGTYTYTPSANFNGTDVFTYKVCDADGDCSTATVTITVNSVDDTPVAVNDTETVNEDGVLTSTVTGNDTPSGDGGNVWSVVTTTTHGTLVFNPNGTYTYTPNANFNGTDVFTYKVCDADGDCSTATVTITVNSVDDVPVAVNDTETVNEDGVLTSTVTGNDTPSGDGGNVWSVVTTTTHGTLMFNPNGTYTYTPNANFNGTDVFTYKVCDADGDCSTATVTITVNSVDDTPVAVNDTESVNEDGVLTSTVTGNDTPSGDGGNVWSVVTTTTHGTLVFNPDGTYTYTPNANYNGPDAFTYKVCDADGDCSTATVKITVVPVNDVPVAVNDAVSTNEDVVIHSTVAGNDTPSPDGGNVWSVVSTTTHGTLVFNTDGSYVYTPNANYNGPDAFTYKLCDANGDCVTAVVNITVIPVNDDPIIKVKNITVYVDATGNVSITPGQIDNGSYDPDGIATITLNKTNFSCSDIATSPNTVTLTVTDVNGNSLSANATVTVRDAIAPTITCPAPVTVQCASAVPAPNTASVTSADNCSYTVSFVSDVVSNQTAPNKYTITRTYRAVDPSGNAATCTQIINVNDNTAPTLIVAGSLPGNSNGQCLAGVPGAPSTAGIAALYSDNCSGSVTAVLSNTTTTGTNAAGWVRKYYYTITDASGNTTTACVTYSGKDTQAPVPNVATLPAITAECNAFVTAPTATDNCAGTITATTTSALSYNAQGNYVITWTYTDGNGNTSTQTQTVIVKDVTPPAVTCPGDITLTANTTVSGQGGANVTYTALAVDNCTTPTITYSKASGSFFPVGTTSVTVTANDGNGNTSTCTFKVIVNCVTPVFTTCPTNKTVNTDAGLCSAVVTYTSAATGTPSAACSFTFSGATTGSGAGNGSGKVFNRGTTTVTITASNLCGTTTCSFVVTVVDNEKPRITAPAAFSVNNDAGKCGATIANLGTPGTSDNCGVASVTNNHPSTFYPVGKTIVIWTVTDVNGNVTDTAKTCVTVLDNELPTTSTTNVTVGNSAGICGANITLAAPVTTDNCGVASVTNNHPSTYYPVGVTTVTWTVTDNAGWTKTTTQTVTVNDTEKPVIVCLPNITLACGLLPIPANTGVATATDNCGVASLTYTDVTSGNVTTRTWKAKDAAGNESTCTQSITVAGPFTAGITSVPTSNTYTGGTANSIFIGYGAQSTVLQTNVPAGVYSYVWSGADASMLSNTNTANPVFTPTRGGTFTYTVTVKNVLGCTSTATITICVTDIRVFASATPPSNNNCGHQSHNSWNCTHSGHGHSCGHGSHNSYNCPDKEDQDDHQGMCNHQTHNSSDCSHRGHNHTCTHRSHSSYNCSHRSCNDRDDDDDHQRTCNHQSHSSSDCSHRGHNHSSCNHQSHNSNNCSHGGSSSDQKVCNHQTHASNDCNHSGHNHGSCNHKPHYSSDCPHNGGNGGTDDDDDDKKVYLCHKPASGISITLSISVNAVADHLVNHPGDRLGSCDQAPCTGYTDNVKPVIDCSDNVTIAYGASTSPAATGSPEADDNSGDVTITYTDASTKGTSASGASYYNYVITRTWKATDLAGNFATCAQTITVTETAKPVIACPANATVGCGSTAPSATGTATATDNSGIVAVTYSDAVIGNKTTRTWKATDPSGNFATCLQTITVVDNVAPVLTEPNDVTVNCGTSTAPAATGTATATDNCSNVTITYTDVTSGNKITRTWKATDASGNYATDVQVITVVDLVKPTITAPNDITISCSASTIPSSCGGGATGSDNCSSVNITYSDVTVGNKITRTWKATDASGNFATDTQLITITDNTKPVITDVSDITINCGTSTTPSGCGSVAQATDNCSTPVVAYSDVTVGNKITRTWTATDAAGNVATSIQIITIVDNVKPVITDPADKTVACGATDPSTTGTATATDACSTPVVTYTDAVSGNKITRTWKATDAAGNFITAVQLITITDAVKPVVTAPNDITVACSNITTPSTTGTATATDACSTPAVTYTDAVSGNKITRTWKATDASGNYATDVQVITIVDLVKPTISAPNDITISCGASTIPSSCGGGATGSDNCSSVTITYSDVTVGNKITRTWKATDASGNFATDTQLITITDNTKPVITDVSDITISCGTSTTPSGCGSVARATDNCSTPVVAYSDVTAGNKITRTWTATDAAGNVATSTQIITIVDNTKPILTVPSNITVNCGGSTATSATGMATATDNCSGATVTFTDATSGNVITRTWKAMDASGNTSTGTQAITMGASFAPAITSVPSSSTYTGGVTTNLYLGYGAQSTTLQMCTLPSAGAPYNYVWSGSAANKLNSATSAAPLFTPATFGYYTFSVTVTNKFGCTSTTSISICVTDVRVAGTSGTGAKVYMCHTPSGYNKTPQTVQVLVSQVPSHLSTSTCGSDGNDRLGTCGQSPCNATVVNTIAANTANTTKEGAETVNTTNEELKVTVMPNPSTTYFTLKFESRYETPINMRVMDGRGRVVDSKTKIGSNSTIQIGHNYASGTYYAELIQGTQRKVIQLIKARG